MNKRHSNKANATPQASRSLCITFDTDWAHEACIEDVLKILDENSSTATFFATNNSYSCFSDHVDIEVGIHPNFNPILAGKGGSIDEVIDELLSIYPDARGMRSHSLTSSSSILSYAKERGIVYDANLFNPHQTAPFQDYSGLVRFTSNWVDYGLLLDGKPLLLDSIPWSADYTNILIFHPIHVFLNTPFAGYYHDIKHDVQDYKVVKSMRNTQIRGIRDLLIDLLRHCKVGGINTRTLSESLLSMAPDRMGCPSVNTQS